MVCNYSHTFPAAEMTKTVHLQTAVCGSFATFKDVSTVAQLTHMNLKKKWEFFRLVIKDNFYKALVLINKIFLDPSFYGLLFSVICS